MNNLLLDVIQTYTKQRRIITMLSLMVVSDYCNDTPTCLTCPLFVKHKCLVDDVPSKWNLEEINEAYSKIEEEYLYEGIKNKAR